MGWLSFGHSYFPLRIAHYVFLGFAVFLILLKFRIGDLENFFDRVGKVNIIVILPYLLTTVLFPCVYFFVTKQSSGNHFSIWLKPLWVFILMPVILVRFNFNVFFKSLSKLFAFSVVSSVPITIYYYLQRGVSFHRVRGNDLIVEFMDLGGFFIYGNDIDSYKAWFQIDTLLNHIVLVCGGIFIAEYLYKIVGERRKGVVLKKAFLLFFALVVVIVWNYFMLTLFLLLILVGVSTFLLFDKNRWRELPFQRNTIFLLIFSIFIFEVGFDKYQEMRFRYETVQDRLNLNQKKIVFKDGFYFYEGLNEAEAQDLNRLSRWKIQWINFVSSRMYFKGVGYIENEKEKEGLYLKSGLFSGHSKIFDDMSRIGVFNGLFLNSIFWLPPFIILALFFRFRSVGLTQLWIKLLVLFGGNLAISLFGTWGEFPAGIALQLYVLFPLVVVCHAIKKDPNSPSEGEFVELKEYGVL